MPSLLHRLIARAPQRLQRDTLEFELDDGRRIEVQRVRHPRARRLKLSVDERGARLTLPMRASREHAAGRDVPLEARARLAASAPTP